VKNLSLTMMLIWLGVFLAACGAASAPAENSSPRASIPRTKIRIGVEAILPSFEVVDSNTGELVGFDIELMKAIAAKANLEVDLVNVGEHQLMPFVEQCRLDGGISAIPIPDELEKRVEFSEPYYTAGQVVVVKKGNLTISDRNTLLDAVIGTQEGTLSEIEIGNIESIRPKAYPFLYLAFQDLITGYIDAVIIDKPHALSYVQTKPNNLKFVGNEFANVDYAIAICKTRTDLTEKINAGLAAVKADGTLDRLAYKWLNSTKQ
jgi:polar amino acid transport system substrate-binding protein